MKALSYFLLAMFLAVATTCGQKGKSKEDMNTSEFWVVDSTLKKTTLKFVSTEHDFGQVQEGEKVKHVFEALNTGKADLLFQNVRTSCGCTTPKYDKKPIRPGKKGTIEVAFDTKGRPGKQRKSVLVVTNTEPPNNVLFFTCEVIPSDNQSSNNP